MGKMKLFEPRFGPGLSRPVIEADTLIADEELLGSPPGGVVGLAMKLGDPDAELTRW